MPTAVDTRVLVDGESLSTRGGTLDVSRRQKVLALRVRSVAAAAGGDDPRLLMEALNDLAMAAFTWADDVRAVLD